MKILLLAVALLASIEGWTEAHPGWMNYPSYPNGRPNYPRQDTSWGTPQRLEENQNNGFSSDVEWVCQNPRTNDMMIIASDDTRQTQQQYPDRGPWQQGHFPPGHNQQGHFPPGHNHQGHFPPGHNHQGHFPPGHNHQGNHWIQPIIIVQETTDKNPPPPVPFPTTTQIPDQTQSPPSHGGEGLIDIRLGDGNNSTK